jgi:hypothetical protein
MADETTNYCTIDDIQRRLCTAIPASDDDDVNSSISDASSFIDIQLTNAGLVPADVSIVAKRLVTIDLVCSWYTTRGIPTGATQMSETVGDVSSSVSLSSSSSLSSFWLSTAQKAMLGIKGSFGSIRMVPGIRI